MEVRWEAPDPRTEAGAGIDRRQQRFADFSFSGRITFDLESAIVRLDPQIPDGDSPG
jgi:hypothetical protein